MEKSKSEPVKYQWEGVNRSGEISSGIIEANSIAIAKAELHKQGFIPKKINKKRKPLFDRSNRRIKSMDITIFTRQFATMLNAGIPVIQAFDIVAKGYTNKRMQALINNIKKEVNTGTTLSNALMQHKKYFNELYCNLVDAGEKSGSLDTMLMKIASYKERTESIKKKVKKALAYPAAVIVVAVLVTAGMLIFVVPQFETLFHGFGAELPAMTRMVMHLSNIAQQYWYIALAIIGGSTYAFIHARKTSPKFAFAFDRFLLKIPIIGGILKSAAIARFARTLSITFAAGLPLVEALKSVSGSTGNLLYAKATNKVRDDISIGHPLQAAMNNTGLFPQMMIQMVSIGEESGSLEHMLSKAADFYEEEVDTAVDALSSLLEPLIMCILGVLVGGLVIAMYLPIFKLGSVV